MKINDTCSTKGLQWKMRYEMQLWFENVSVQRQGCQLSPSVYITKRIQILFQHLHKLYWDKYYFGEELFTKQIFTKCQPGTVLAAGKEVKKPRFLPFKSLHSDKAGGHGVLQMRLPCFTCFCKALWALWKFWQTCPAFAMPSSQYFDYLFLWLYQFNFQFLVDGFKKERLLEVDITVLGDCEAGLLSPNWGPPKTCHREETMFPPAACRDGARCQGLGAKTSRISWRWCSDLEDIYMHDVSVLVTFHFGLLILPTCNFLSAMISNQALDLKCLFMTEITTSRCLVQAQYFTYIILILPKILLRGNFLGGKTKAERS